MKKRKSQNKSESKILKIVAMAENMMAMPKNIILKLKTGGDKRNEKWAVSVRYNSRYAGRKNR